MDMKSKKRINLFKQLKKVSRSALIKKLDKKISDIVRERDNWTCQRCFKPYTPPTNALHCSHYFSRRYLGTRWDLDNLIALCYGCHRLWEGDKMGAYTDLMEKMLGKEKLELLRIKAYGITKFSIMDLELMLRI